MPNGELSQPDINRLALEQHMRAIKDTDEFGYPKEGIEHHPIAAQIAGKWAVAEARDSDGPTQLFGYDDNEEFRQVQLGEA
ncbi:MAG TPA: hypothetical protein VLF39_00920 [Candidatus Saccharimonadales bacterium]|nr:hypothetical protein [Candidatus Saccharimonadales bacterium]